MRSPDLLHLTVEPLEDARLIRARGELDMSSAVALRAELDAARAELVTVVLDLSDVIFMDSTGLNLLLEASRSAAVTDWAFFIVRPSTAVRRVIDVSRTADLLTLVEPSAERRVA